MSVVCSDVPKRSFQHNPYDKRILDLQGADVSVAAVEFLKASAAAAANESKPSSPEKSLEMMDGLERMTSTEAEGGMSDNGTDEAGHTTSSAVPFIPAAVSASVPFPLPLSLRYASVNFRFGSAWFLAPFRTAVGEMVVVEYPHNQSLHLGIVSCITTRVPPTFAALCGPDGTIGEEELRETPRLLRHARDFDKQTKVELRSHDFASLKNAQTLALEMEAPVTFIDAEWLLDLTAVTFLVNVWGDMSLVDRLADELATIEGAEVVFTYPALN